MSGIDSPSEASARVAARELVAVASLSVGGSCRIKARTCNVVTFGTSTC